MNHKIQTNLLQLGCYVPAQSAQFRVTDRILSRIGFNDSIEKNLSTFMLEVNFSKFHSSISIEWIN